MKLRQMVAAGMLAALTAVVTRMIQIPSPATNGYINAGDIVILFSSYYAGPLAGFFIGGAGSALADILSGYPFYYVTFIIKGIEGIIAGALPRYFNGEAVLNNENSADEKLSAAVRFLAAAICGAVFMVAGYFCFHILVYGRPKAYMSLPGNIFQALAGVLGSLILFKKGPVRLLKDIYQNNK